MNPGLCTFHAAICSHAFPVVRFGRWISTPSISTPSTILWWWALTSRLMGGRLVTQGSVWTDVRTGVEEVAGDL